MVVEILLGVALGVGITCFELLFNERICKAWISFPLFLAGLYFLYKLPLKSMFYETKINLTIFLTAVIVRTIYMLYSSYTFSKEINKDAKGFFWNRKYSRKDGYYISKELEDNASVLAPFGKIVLGRKSSRGIFSRLFGLDGWSKTERKAILNHEKGHIICAFPNVLLEVYIFFFFFANFSFNTRGLSLILTLFSASTLLSWLDELAADSFAGKNLIGPLNYFLSMCFFWVFFGSFCAHAHPPYILRIFACVSRVFMFIIWGLPFALAYFYW